MPTKIPGYHARWIAKRRADYFEGKRCVRCGSTKKLELDHKDPDAKVSHCIWSWRESRRMAEIAKCQILCHECHRKKTAEEMRQLRSGIPNVDCRKFTDQQISEIRQRLASGESSRSVGRAFGVSHPSISNIKRFKTYRFPTNKETTE